MTGNERNIITLINYVREDLNDYKKDTDLKLDEIIEHVTSQKTERKLIKWWAAFGGVAGITAFFKSFLNIQ